MKVNTIILDDQNVLKSV